MSDALRLLKQPNVLKLFIAYLITHTGTAMAPIAMAFGVLELTGSAHDTSYVMAASTLASVLVLLLGGAVADRTSRKKVILLSELLAAFIQAVIAFLFFSQHASVSVLVALMFMNGVAIAFNAPATVGLVPLLVEKNELQAVNALLGMAKNGAMVGGAALAGVLVAFVGAGFTILLDAISFVVSAIIISTLTPAEQIKTPSHSIVQDLKDGWREFVSHTWIWTIVLQFAFVIAAYQAVIAVTGPAIAVSHYAGAKSWGWIMSALSLGLVVGGIIGMKFQPRFPMRFATFCVFFAAAIPLGVAFLLPLLVLIVIAFIAGIAWEMFVIIWVSTLQQKISPQALSRVSAYDYIGSIGLAPLAIVLAGYFYDRVGYQLVALTSAATIIIATLLVLFVKDVWNMRRQ